MNPRQRTLLALVALAVAALIGWIRQREGGPSTDGAPPPKVEANDSTRPSVRPKTSGERRDLAADEARGGHTLARHVGKADRDLVARLRKEPDISASSGWSDQETAERIVGAALADGGDRIAKWLDRPTPRPNLLLGADSPDGRPLGRSVRRGERKARDCFAARIVLKDAGESDWFVLTAYPEVKP